jgi:hypothetical protein
MVGVTAVGAGDRRRLPGSAMDGQELHPLSFGRVTSAGDTRVPSRHTREVVHTVRSVRVRVMTCR